MRGLGGGGVSGFFVENFMSHSAKNFGGHLFSVSLIWRSEKLCASQGYVTISLRTFVSLYRKTLQGNSSVLCFGTFPVANKFMDKKGGMSRLPVGNFSSHSSEKCRRGIL